MDSNLPLSSCAKLALIGLSYVYVAKFIDTVWYGLFANPAISLVVVSLNILAGIGQLLFFYKLQSLSSNSGFFTGIAGWAGIIGASINMIPKIHAFSVLLQFHFSFKLIKNSQVIALLSPWAGALMLFCCCLMFFLLSAKLWRNKTRFFLFGAVGYMTLVGTFSILVFNFFSGAQVNWQLGGSGTGLTYFIISASFSFLCIAYFYTGFFSDNEYVRCDESLE